MKEEIKYRVKVECHKSRHDFEKIFETEQDVDKFIKNVSQFDYAKYIEVSMIVTTEKVFHTYNFKSKGDTCL